jgi:TPR repeat protein
MQLGAGVAADQQVATELYRAAAAAGDPEALGHWGLRLAYGLQDPAAAQGNAIKYFSQVGRRLEGGGYAIAVKHWQQLEQHCR